MGIESPQIIKGQILNEDEIERQKYEESKKNEDQKKKEWFLKSGQDLENLIQHPGWQLILSFMGASLDLNQILSKKGEDRDQALVEAEFAKSFINYVNKIIEMRRKILDSEGGEK